MEVSFHRFAEMEMNEAASYYQAERPGLGTSFLKEVDHCIDSIVKFPRSGQIILDPVRRRLLRRFPYGILYTIKPEGVRILAVMNLKRRPFYWVGRS